MLGSINGDVTCSSAYYCVGSKVRNLQDGETEGWWVASQDPVCLDQASILNALDEAHSIGLPLCDQL